MQTDSKHTTCKSHRPFPSSEVCGKRPASPLLPTLTPKAPCHTPSSSIRLCHYVSPCPSVSMRYAYPAWLQAVDATADQSTHLDVQTSSGRGFTLDSICVWLTCGGIWCMEGYGSAASGSRNFQARKETLPELWASLWASFVSALQQDGAVPRLRPRR